MGREAGVCWLQLSDLHIFYSTEWEIMLKSYEDLAQVFKPDFIVVTGDFRHRAKNKSFEPALKFLDKLAAVFSLSKVICSKSKNAKKILKQKSIVMLAEFFLYCFHLIFQKVHPNQRRFGG